MTSEVVVLDQPGASVTDLGWCVTEVRKLAWNFGRGLYEFDEFGLSQAAVEKKGLELIATIEESIALTKRIDEERKTKRLLCEQHERLRYNVCVPRKR